MYVAVAFNGLTNDCLMYGRPYNLARGLAPLPSLLPSYGPSQRDCGGLRELLTPPGVQQCLAAPPLEVIGDSSRTRARVSPRLGLAPALLLGQVSPATLSTVCFVSASLAHLSPMGGPRLHVLPSPSAEEAPALLLGGPAASGSGLPGHASSAQARCPCHRGYQVEC